MACQHDRDMQSEKELGCPYSPEGEGLELSSRSSSWDDQGYQHCSKGDSSTARLCKSITPEVERLLQVCDHLAQIREIPDCQDDTT